MSITQSDTLSKIMTTEKPSVTLFTPQIVNRLVCEVAMDSPETPNTSASKGSPEKAICIEDYPEPIEKGSQLSLEVPLTTFPKLSPEAPISETFVEPVDTILGYQGAQPKKMNDSLLGCMDA